MQFQTPPRRRPAESIVPMINVVFLLLIFFLMSAQIAPPLPFDVTPPVAGEVSTPAGDAQLYVSADGEVALGDLRGQAVFGALAANAPDGPLELRADAALPGAALARILRQLGEAGLRDVQLITVNR